ncbi:MAG: L,D-transpeptidase/peptidoglycan binding protein [Actinomycetota bacterium]|nr:L,D-transpeptidase/peptidoglycan binding protein [Actinomycetota bacterium]
MLAEEAIEVIPRKDARPAAGSAWKKVAAAFAVLVLLAALAAGGVAWATQDYAAKYEDRLLPGTSIAGVDVSGMTPTEALASVKASIRPELTRKVAVTWRDRRWTTTPQELGARSDARRAVQAAVAASDRVTFMEKARMRWLGERMSFRDQVAITHPRKGIKGFVSGIAQGLFEEPEDAALDYSSGWVNIVPGDKGRRVVEKDARAALSGALLKNRGTVPLPVNILEPEVTAAAYDQVLLVRIGENKLYLYNDGEITNSWSVATGQPEYMTPTGVYSVTEKRYLPTWVNPAPDTWGADMPAEIPPGPDNPLGVRAINWSAPAIRFHGTEATYSLGYNASHGCVRMSNTEVIQLYDMIDLGTPIVSLVAAPLKPLYASAPDPTPVAENSAENGGSNNGGADN